MKKLVIILSTLISSSCTAPKIHEELNGCWLPEKYILAVIANDTSIADKFLFPVEAFEISEEKTVAFLKDSELENETKDIHKIVLMKTYKSELNSVHAENIVLESKEQYSLPYFYPYLNTK
jgi:hypothetical protein